MLTQALTFNTAATGLMAAVDFPVFTQYATEFIQDHLPEESVDVVARMQEVDWHLRDILAGERQSLTEGFHAAVHANLSRDDIPPHLDTAYQMIGKMWIPLYSPNAFDSSEMRCAAYDNYWLLVLEGFVDQSNSKLSMMHEAVTPVVSQLSVFGGVHEALMEFEVPCFDSTDSHVIGLGLALMSGYATDFLRLGFVGFYLSTMKCLLGSTAYAYADWDDRGLYYEVSAERLKRLGLEHRAESVRKEFEEGV